LTIKTVAPLAEIPEGVLVEKLINNSHWRGRIVGLHGIPSDVIPHIAVPLWGVPGRWEGDIDILLVPPGRPECTTAVEVKRIKVSDTAFASGQPNKLNEFEKGIRQANTLADIGFSQVYYFVFVVVDS